MLRLTRFFPRHYHTNSWLRLPCHICAALRRLAHLVGCYRSLISEYETGRCRAACEKSKKISQCYEPIDFDCALG